MKLTVRFLILVLALLLAVGVSGQQGIGALNRLGGALERVVDADMERVFAITHVRRLFRSMIVLEGEYLLATSDAERQQMDKKMVSLAKEQLEQIEKYTRLMPADDTKTMTEIRAARERWIALNARVRDLAASDHEQALALSKQHGKDPVNWEKAISDLVRLSETRLASQVKETKTIHQSATRSLMLVSFAAAAVAFGLGLVIYLGIRSNLNQVLELNSNLEKLVAERTCALAQREASLRLVLDSTGDAFIKLDEAGRLAGETSAMTKRCFGDYAVGQAGASYLFREDPELQETFDIAYAQLVEDVLPWEVALEQMPKRVEIGEAIFELEYRPVDEEGQARQTLIVARDVTARVQSELAERNVREQQAVIGKLLADKTGFAQFVTDCESLIGSLANESDPAVLKRDLHTLKGNTAVFGMTSVSEHCHKLEDILASSSEPLSAGKIADLASLWRSKLQSLEGFLVDMSEKTLQINDSEHQQLIDSLMQRRDYRDILSMVEAWSWSRAADRLTRLRAQTEYVAKRLGKEIQVVTNPHDIRIPNDYLVRFWPTLIHVIRNAVDHGLEIPSERESAGKTNPGTVEISTFEEDNELVIQVRDDGRGIDPTQIVRAAKSRGLTFDEDSTLLDRITKGSITTRATVSETSGRGIGLASVRATCEQEGGHMVLINEPGRGATFQFRFRMPVVKTGALAARLARRWSLKPPTPEDTAARASQTVRLDGVRRTS